MHPPPNRRCHWRECLNNEKVLVLQKSQGSMFQEEGTESVKVPVWEEVWSAQIDTETRPMWLSSPTPPHVPTTPALNPAIDADVTGTMTQDIGFISFSASDKILPGSDSEALGWLWWDFISYFTLWFRRRTILIERQPWSLGEDPKHKQRKIFSGRWCCFSSYLTCL